MFSPVFLFHLIYPTQFFSCGFYILWQLKVILHVSLSDSCLHTCATSLVSYLISHHRFYNTGLIFQVQKTTFAPLTALDCKHYFAKTRLKKEPLSITEVPYISSWTELRKNSAALQTRRSQDTIISNPNHSITPAHAVLRLQMLYFPLSPYAPPVLSPFPAHLCIRPWMSLFTPVPVKTDTARLRSSSSLLKTIVGAAHPSPHMFVLQNQNDHGNLCLK